MPQEFQTTAGTSTTRSHGEAANVRDQAKQSSEGLRKQAGQAAETAREELGAAAEKARHATTDAARRAKEEAQSFMARQKDAAANEISHLGEAVQRAAEKLHEEEDHNVASYVEAAANRARSTAEYLQQRDVTDLFADMQTMARRHPTAVCGGMFAAGVAIARFLKASPPAPTANRASANVEAWQRNQPQSITTT